MLKKKTFKSITLSKYSETVAENPWQSKCKALV